jgi:hypothetical protein
MFDGEVMLVYPTETQVYNEDITPQIIDDYIKMVVAMLKAKTCKIGDSIV